MARERQDLLKLCLGINALVRKFEQGDKVGAEQDALEIWMISSEDQWPVLVDYADYLGVNIETGFGNRPTALGFTIEHTE